MPNSDWILIKNSSSESLNSTKVNMDQTDQQEDSKNENLVHMDQTTDHQKEEELKSDKDEQKEEELKSDKDEQKEELKSDKDEQMNKLTDLVYLLEWSKRDELFSLLNQYSSFIWLKSNDDKEELIEKNLNLYRDLINLPLKSTAKKSNDISNSKKNRLVLELGYDEKSKIVLCLIDNQNSTLLSDDNLTNQIKQNLLNQNNNLIMNLLKLPVRIVEIDQNGEINQNVDLNSNGNNSSEDKDIQKKINSVDERLNGLEENLNDMKQKIDLNSDESKTECTFEFGNIKEFIDAEIGETKSSPLFICKSISWYIKLVKQEVNELKYLGLYLYHSNLDCLCSIDTNCEFTLLNQSGKEDKYHLFQKTFETKNTAWGYPKFILLDKLQNGGYIKENKIKIKIELKVNQLIIH